MEEESKNSEITARPRGKPFKKGETGNENGRPLGQKNYATLYKEALIKLAKSNNEEPSELELEIISKGLLNAKKGDYRFYKDVLDRIHGQATTKQELEVSLPETLIEVIKNGVADKGTDN